MITIAITDMRNITTTNIIVTITIDIIKTIID